MGMAMSKTSAAFDENKSKNAGNILHNCYRSFGLRLCVAIFVSSAFLPIAAAKFLLQKLEFPFMAPANAPTFLEYIAAWGSTEFHLPNPSIIMVYYWYQQPNYTVYIHLHRPHPQHMHCHSGHPRTLVHRRPTSLRYIFSAVLTIKYSFEIAPVIKWFLVVFENRHW